VTILLDKLRILIDQLQSIPKLLQELTNAIGAATERWTYSNSKSLEELRLAREAEQKRETEQDKHYRIQRCIARGTWAAFIAAVFYAGISYEQWQAMKEQNENSARAWLGYQQEKDSDLPIVIDKLEASQELHLEAHYTVENFGNGPAVKVITSFDVETDRNIVTLRKAAAFICDSTTKFTTGTVPVGTSYNPGPEGFILFPNQTNTDKQTRIVSGLPGDLRWVVVMGCVSYIDQFMKAHWTRFAVIVGDGKSPISLSSPQKLYTLFNDTNDTLQPMAEPADDRTH
jgi:hypothetical protein